MSGNELYWVGVDVSKRHFDAAYVLPGERFAQERLCKVPVAVFERNREGVALFLAWLAEQGVAVNRARAVMEATGPYSVELCEWMREQCADLAPAIVNPAHTSAFIKSLGVRNKTDRLDARALAFYGAERQPAAYEPLTPAHQQLRELSRYRDALMGEKVAESNRSEQGAQSKVVRKLQERREEQRRRDIAKIQKEMERLIERTPELKRDFDLLNTIPGVAFVTASVVLAELGDLRRFARARQAASFVGLSPRQRQSGTSINGKTRMCKCGNSRVRHALYLAAMTAAREGSPMRGTYLNLLQNGRSRMAALGVIMRKLLVLMRAILIAETAFDPCQVLNKRAMNPTAGRSIMA